MSNRMFYPLRGSLNREVVTLYGTVTTTTNGTIGSQDCKGFSVARTSTGLYTITLQDAYAATLDVRVLIIDTTITPGKGQIIAVSADTPLLASIAVKFYRPDTQVVADVDDGAILKFVLTLSRVALS